MRQQPMRVLQVFDQYLPSTLNWVGHLLAHLPVSVCIGASWTMKGVFRDPRYRLFVNPMQRLLVGDAPAEFDHRWAYRLTSAVQSRTGLYPLWLRVQLRDAPPDLIHAHFGPVGCLYAPMARRMRRPLVVSFYGFDYTRVPQGKPQYRKRYKALFDQAAAVVSCSKEVGVQRLVDLGCPPDKIHAVAPGIDLSRFAEPPRWTRRGPLRMVQLATITPKKGQDTAIQALSLALAECPDLHLTFAGEVADAVYRRTLADLAGRLGVSEHITWAPFVPAHEVPVFLGGYDVFVHPSRHTDSGDHETTPVVILEAQACGLPVLATRHWDIPFQVLDGQTGILVEEGDARALATAMLRFSRMEAVEYERFSRQGRDHVGVHFDIQGAASHLMSIYHGVV
jgi:colanic acid/amylovoran biosynthesis glycosyltransferase